MKNRSGRSSRMLITLFGKSLRKSGLSRALRSESLEQRHMMAGDTYLPYHNDLIAEDTNGDYNISALDALLVINALNSGQAGQLTGPGVGKADGPRVDVSGDNFLTALDALQVINSLNAEAEEGDIVGFEYEFTDRFGAPLANNTASVNQLVQLRTYVQDLRGFNAQGVFTAFLDLDYSDATKFQLNVGEVQSFKYFFDRISTTNTSSNFKFTFDGQTTGPVNLFNGNSARSADAVGAAIQTALEALPNIGAGNVVVRRDAVTSAADQTANRRRNSYDIIFANEMAGKDVSLITVDVSGIVMQAGQTLDFEMIDKHPASQNDPAAVAAAFFFSDEFTTGRNAQLGTNQFDEVGATGGLGAPANPGERRLFFTATFRTLAAGTVTFTPNPAEEFPAHETLVFPKDTVPTTLIEYGTPFNLVIAAGLVANNDAFTVAEDAGNAQFNVTSNDTLITGTSFAVTSLGTPTNGGTISIVSGGSQVNYQPAANFFGTETFTYTITNNNGVTSTATVTMTVTPVNDPISVPNQTSSTNLGKAVTLTTEQLIAGGSVGPGESAIQQLSVASANSPSSNGGVVSLNNGSVTYTPAAGFSGVDTFTVVVTDNGQTNGAPAPSTQSVTVTVTVTNDPPDAVNDLIDTVDEDTSNNTLNVLSNDTAGTNDVGDSLTISAVGGTPLGAVVISGDGKTLSYTPPVGFVGQDTFTYTARDTGGLTDTATVIVDVQATVLPRARIDTAVSTEDSTTPVVIDVLDNDRTNVNTVPVLISFTQPANGTVTLNNGGTPADGSDDTLSYVPNQNFSGVETFTYVMNETPAGTGVNSTGTVSVTVADVNDPPILVNDAVSATEGAVTTIAAATLLSNDSPGLGETTSQKLTITGVQAVSSAGGTVALSGTNVIYTPSASFNGSFVFNYTAADSGSPSQSATATVTITVDAVNEAPVVVNDNDTTAEDTAKTITATTLLANDRPGPATATDEATQKLTIIATGSSARGGTVVLNPGGASIVYTPPLNFSGSDTFTYTVRDDGTPNAQATGTVTIAVSAVNDSPIAGSDSVGGFKGVPLTISPTTLLANDQPGPADESSQTLSITSVSGAVNGTVSLVGGQIVFTPDSSFTGNASFQYTITDNGQTAGVNDFKTATGTVNVTVQEFVPSAIMGMVYVDETNDGVKQSAERSLGGVVVTLTGTALGQPVFETYTTLADGSYSFNNLAPGNYTVSIVNPELMIDGKDTAGSLGDADGVEHNNSFGINIASPGGTTVSNYNFGVLGVTNGYASILERLASRYYASGSTMASNGLYATLSSDGAQRWFSKLDGFNGVQYAEVTMNSSGTEGVLTIVDSAHNVFAATLAKGKFLSMHDGSGNTIVRVLGGLGQLQFTPVDLAAPPVRSTNRFLDSIDHVFAQEGWVN
ncbi:MAG: tandem-95 repeat protein [Pirellulaceae bacterium]|nr:tandem-95 repeat protein [Pirellulaceae bacterium]